jgi:hypothetical protein
VAESEAFRKVQSEKGSASGKKRAEAAAAKLKLLEAANPGSTPVQPEANREGTEGQPGVNSPPPSPPPPPSPEKKRTRAQAPAAGTLYRWEEFAGMYPADGLTYDAAGKSWWASNVKWGDDALVDSILAGVKRWNAGSWHQKGIVANCAKFLRNRAFDKPVPGEIGGQPQPDIFAGCENLR